VPSLVIIVSVFSVLSCRQTNRQTDADDRYTHATPVGVSNNYFYGVITRLPIHGRLTKRYHRLSSTCTLGCTVEGPSVDGQGLRIKLISQCPPLSAEAMFSLGDLVGACVHKRSIFRGRGGEGVKVLRPLKASSPKNELSGWLHAGLLPRQI